MCDIARIDRFLSKHPNAEYGPAHIVLSDANLRDDHLDWCLGLLDSLVDGKPWPKTRIEADFYKDHPLNELRATQAFLRKLRRLPFAERIQEGDRICGGVGSLS